MVQHLPPSTVRLHHIRYMPSEILHLDVLGMSCGNCARSIEKKLSSTPGVTKASVDLEAARATVEYDTDLVKPDALTKAVRDLGYDVAA
jgi:copper chaperone CopZ